MLGYAIFATILIGKITADMDAKIIGGNFAKISDFPHVVLLYAICSDKSSWICGSTVINQRILLTAAHCLEGCDDNGGCPDTIQALAGTDNHKKKGTLTEVKQFLKHELWDEEETTYDIGLVRLIQDLPLGRNIKRTIVPRRFPKIDVAEVAGWGLVDDEEELSTNRMKYTVQRISYRSICKLFSGKGNGQLCVETTGDSGDKDGWPSQGDSGSGLVTHDHKLLGIVSMRLPEYPQNPIYTNVTFFYDWIMRNSKILFC